MNTPGLYDRFAATVRQWPDQLALEVADHRLTYRELADAADRLAALVLAARPGRPRRVGVLAGRSLTAYAGYLAALRAGATVVPLNPSFPTARLALLCAQAGVDVVITDVEVPAGLPAETAVVDLCDDTPLRPGAGPVPVVDAAPASTGVAYLLFTSGSTGVPKGVPVTHANTVEYLDLSIARYGAGPGCRFSQTFDLTFDPSVFDLFVAWGSGATVVVPRRDELMAPVDFVNRRGITHWYSVPWFAAMADRLGLLTPNAMPGLRWSLFIGDRLTLDEAGAWQRAAPGSTVENTYGPTELTVSCTTYRLPAERDAWPVTANGTVPIGDAYPHLEAVVLDENGHPADDGELCVRGPQRFAGYLDPADNAGRFLSWDGHTSRTYDGTGPLDETHWYRTGDRVRAGATGLVHIGRLDHQVKVQGYRIELGEIEALVRAHDSVDDAIVLAVPARLGGLEIVAAVTGPGVRTADLTSSLCTQLPRYMVPARIKHLPSLPLNDSRKIDRRRLAAAFA